MAKVYTRVHRLLRLISAIQSRRDLNVADLSRLCEVHERTIYRDLDTLNASGVPCALDPATGGYRVANGFFMPPVELTFEEAMAVVALLEDAGDGDLVPYLSAASRAAEKLRAQFPAAVSETIDALTGRVHIDLARAAADESARDVYDDVRRAIVDRRVLRCRYDSPKRPERDAEQLFDFKPYALWFCQRAWYAVGHHGGRDAVRRLKLNRFTAVEVTDRSFEMPADFDLHADLGHAWRMIRGQPQYRVRVRFEPAFADAASETRWHPTQEEEWDDAGRVTLTFTVDGLEEIVWWVLGYGPGVTVLEPAELAEQLRTLAAAVAEKYRRKDHDH